MLYPHHSATAVVVKVHQSSSIFYHPLLGVYKGLGKLDAIVDIVTTATPVKVTHFVSGFPPLVGVTAADLELPLAACSGDGIDYSR